MIVGQTLGQYRIVKHLGEGAMGDVYHAVDELLDRDVALKMLRPALAHRHDLVARFRVEATTLAKLDHPNITHLLGLVKHEADLFMVMEYVNGETLSDVVQRGGPLRWREAVAWVGEVLAALEYAHDVGVVHRLEMSDEDARAWGEHFAEIRLVAKRVGAAEHRILRLEHQIRHGAARQPRPNLGQKDIRIVAHREHRDPPGIVQIFVDDHGVGAAVEMTCDA